MLKKLKLHPTIKLRFLNDDGEKILGPGVAQLLENIEITGSLRSACAKMGMAYSKAWKMVKQCEKNLNVILLERKTGGEDGGGSYLTESAKEILKEFKTYEKGLEKKLEELFY